MVMVTDPFWLDKPSVLFDGKRLTHFFPSKTMVLVEKMNALVRLGIYISIVLIVYKGNFKYINLAVFFMLLTVIVVKNQSDKSKKEEEKEIEKMTNNIDLDNFKSYREAKLIADGKTEVPPVEGNPFGNLTFVDILDKPERGPASDITDPEIKKQIDGHFNKYLYNDVTEVFGKMNSQRQFYTMPVTETVNDRDSFQKWLYGDGAINSGFGKTCKEDQNACYRYNDPRQQQQILENKYINPSK
jgi:hypothetical protein